MAFFLSDNDKKEREKKKKQRARKRFKQIASGGGHGSLAAETAAIVARMTALGSTPSAGRTAQINSLVKALKNAGVWTKLDLLYVLAAHSAAAARVNWITPASFTLTEVNSPTFTIDRGYTGNGTNMELTTGFVPNANAVQLSQNSMHVFALDLTAGANTNTFDFGEATGTLIGARARTGTGGAVRCQDGVSTAAAAGGSLPVEILGIRRDAGNKFNFRNGVQSSTAAAASSALSANSVSVLRAISTFTDRQVAMCGLGGALSDAEALAAFNARLTYLQAIGAA